MIYIIPHDLYVMAAQGVDCVILIGMEDSLTSPKTTEHNKSASLTAPNNV